MNIQEQEERDFHPASDAQNAYAWSSMNRKPDDSAKIKELAAAGRHVVYSSGTDYCPSTDAILGARWIYESDHATAEEAQAAAAILAEHYNEECYTAVYQAARQPSAPRRLADNELIPF